MKKLTFLLAIAFSYSALAQNILWEQTGLKVKEGNGAFVVDVVDKFYSSIEMPDGVSVSLNWVRYRPEGTETTHYLTFGGTAEGIVKLRELRDGDAYDAYSDALGKLAKITSSVSGSTLVRMNADKMGPMAQVWQWSVEDPEKFVKAFMTLTKGFPQEGYLSMGLISQGASKAGESHYVYTTHKDYLTALSWGPKTEEQQKAFITFQKVVNPISDYLGTQTFYTVKTWN
ncbi:MAG: hypothetical protein ACPGC8_06810 [Flavobacteriaceae bacterium]